MTRNRPIGKAASTRIPGFTALVSTFQRIAAVRAGRLPVGLLALLPVALFLDFFDMADELFAGPVGMLLSFALESAFVLGVTGRPTYALGFAGVDLIPGVDIIPFATIALVRELARAWNEAPDVRQARAGGPVIDV